MKLSRQVLRRLAREAKKKPVEFIPSLTKKPQPGESKHVRAGFTKNHGNPKGRTRSKKSYKRSKKSYKWKRPKWLQREQKLTESKLEDTESLY